MKLAVCAILASTATAFTAPTMTFAVGKKAPAKKAAPTATKKVEAPKKAVAATKAVAAKPVAAKPAAKAAAKPAPKAAATKPAPKVAATKPAPKVVAKPAPKVVAKPAPKVVAKVVAKPAPKPAPKPVAPKRVAVASGVVPSTAIPNEAAPAILDGSLPGDVGFDPCFLSTKADLMAPYFNSAVGGANIDGLTWYREAELMHGRICMVAVLGFIIPGFGTFPGNEWTGLDAYSYTNPLEAFDKAPSASLLQIAAFMSILEFRRISNIKEQGSNYMAGDSQRWGQGEGRWNPFGLNYTPEEYAEKQLQEVKHARLAMVGLLGLIFQANASGVNVVQQWSTAFTTPEYYAKAGYFLPEGI